MLVFKKYFFVFVLLAACFSFFYRLGDRPLRNPDEGRYAEIAREMVVSNDWIEPTLYGADYLRKPVLFYWLLALSFKLFGVSAFAARLVPALFGFLTVLGTYRFVKKTSGLQEAFFASLLLTANVWHTMVSRYLLIDSVFSFLLVMSFYSFYLKEYWRFYIYMALAFLAKGLAAPVIMVFCLSTYTFWNGSWRETLKEMHLFRGLALFVAISAPWYVAIAIHEPEFLNFFFVHEHFTRFASGQFEHQQPIFYYFLALPLMLLPWILFWRPLKNSVLEIKKGGRCSREMYLLFCAAGTLLFFSASKSKLPTYLLPCLPLLSIILGRGWMRFLENTSKLWPARLFVSLALVLVLSTAPIAWTMEAANPPYSTRSFAFFLKDKLSPEDTVYIYDQPGAFYDFEFYLERPVKLVGLEGELEFTRGDYEEEHIAISKDAFHALLEKGEPLYCLMRKSDFLEMTPELKKHLTVLIQDKRKILAKAN